MNRFSVFGVALALTLPGTAGAQDLDLGGATLEDLLNVKTAVTTKKETNARRSPGIVSIITDEDIHRLGARDLIDVLRLIPGIEFGNDVQGVVGMGIRGMWGHEGKILVIVDGIEMNEIQYGSYQFGNEFPVDHIKRIEVIRGPGSVTYGGFAELAVINIITKKGADLKGIAVQANYGRFESVEARRNLGAQVGIGSESQDFSAAGYVGQAKRGDGVYTGYDGTSASGSFDYEDADEIQPRYANIGLRVGDFNSRFIYNDYDVSTRSMFGYTGLDENIPNHFRSYSALLSYDLHIGSMIKITPQVQATHQVPWLQDSDAALSTFKVSDIESQRIKAGVNVSVDPTENLNFLVGVEKIDDRHEIDRQYDTTGPLLFRSGGDQERYSSLAYIAQAIVKTLLVDVTVGARYEDPDFTESSLVPRVGLTSADKNWHAKLLYAQAFRTPVIFNIDARPAIKPENTETLELEVGHSVTTNSYLTANIFNTKIENSIVYYYDTVASADQYDNLGEVGTRGIELDYRYRPTWGQIQLGYIFTEVIHNNVDRYRVDQDDTLLVGMPEQKAVLNTWFNLAGPRLRLNNNLTFYDERWAYEYDSAAGAMALHKSSATTVFSAFVTYDDALVKGLSLGGGMFNLFNQDVRYIQPYNGGHSPAPGPSREVLAKIEYKRNF